LQFMSASTFAITVAEYPELVRSIFTAWQAGLGGVTVVVSGAVGEDEDDEHTWVA